ncbi:hypothetical protein VTK56DRAFT_5814 [Thermocarpiscus australiensis]
MRPFIFQCLLLGGVGRVAALALFAGQHVHDKNATALSLNKRQGTAIVTKYFTIFAGGDASKPRTANSGFDVRVDLLHDLFGFCPTTVIAATDCGLAGSCVDRFGCSKGCGFTGEPLTTFTCSKSDEPFCSTALLTLSGGVGPFTYLGCGKGPSTDEYMAFTTQASAPSSESQSAAPTTTSSSSSDSTTSPQATSVTQSTSVPQATSASPTTSVPQLTSNGSRSGISTVSDTASSEATSTARGDTQPNASSNSTNMGAIIGAVLGGLALLCGSALAVVWLLHRSKAANVPSSSPVDALPADQPPPGYRHTTEIGAYKVAELGDNGVGEMATPEVYRLAYRGMAPAELPVSPVR